MFGRKPAGKRPKRDRIRITATGFGLEQDSRTVYMYVSASTKLVAREVYVHTAVYTRVPGVFLKKI